MGPYYTREHLAKYLGIKKSLNFKLVMTDNYNEYDIEDTIIKTDMIEELKCVAIQTAIVGTGKQVLGSILLGKEEIPIRKICEDANVKLDLGQSAKLGQEELTIRRLQRFFRYTVADYIEKNKVQSYLYKKYSDHDEKYMYKVFPGAEHMLEDRDECKYLLETYLRLDFQLKTTISDRIGRIFSTRNILTVKEVDEFKKNFIAMKKELRNLH